MDEPAPLTISSTAAADGSLIEVSGELDLSNVDRLGAAINECLQSDPDHLTLDVSGLRFMDSSGIALLVRTHTRIESLTLRQPSAIVRRLIEATGLTEILATDP